MYKLIFYFFYIFFLRRNDPSPRFGAICGVFLVVVTQLILIYVLVQKIVGELLIEPGNQSYTNTKGLVMLAGLPFLVGTILYFNKKRIDSILKYYENKEDVFSYKNWILFSIFSFVPLFLIMLLLK